MAGIFFLSLYDFIARIFKLSCRFFAWFLKIKYFCFPPGDGTANEEGSNPRLTPDVCRTGSDSPALKKLTMTQTLL